MKLSVCIPTYKVEHNVDLLTRALESLWAQNMQDFEIIVSDNSTDDKILNVCQYYGSVRYERNPVKGMAQNTNHALRRAEGELVKILYMDDYMAHDDALSNIWNGFTGTWMVTGCEHTTDGLVRTAPHYPSYNDQIHLGKNTIGSPSVLTMRRDSLLFFDEKMTWLLDCDLYRRLYDAYGAPTVLDDINVVIGLGEHQASHWLPDEVKNAEKDYMLTKYS